jgi:hypothetical protein
MGHPLDGAFAKLDRANQQINELQEHIRAFVDTSQIPAYIARFERNCERVEYRPIPEHVFQTSGIPLGELTQPYFMLDDGILSIPFVAEEVSICLDAVRQFPIIEFGVRIGEIAHDLRCALDYIVWELSVKEQRTRPPAVIPFPSQWTDWTKLQFPVRENNGGWKTALKNGQLWAIDQNLVTDFEGLQPYSGGKNYHTSDLWILQQLWNSDKHRTVTVVANVMGVRNIDLSEFEQRPGFIAAQILSRRGQLPFEDGAELARYKFLWLPTNTNPA